MHILLVFYVDRLSIELYRNRIDKILEYIPFFFIYTQYKIIKFSPLLTSIYHNSASNLTYICYPILIIIIIVCTK